LGDPTYVTFPLLPLDSEHILNSITDNSFPILTYLQAFTPDQQPFRENAPALLHPSLYFITELWTTDFLKGFANASSSPYTRDADHHLAHFHESAQNEEVIIP